MTFENHACAFAHKRYMQKVNPRSRFRCHCGCKKVAKYMGMANGVCLTKGCEMYIRRWVRDGIKAARAIREQI